MYCWIQPHAIPHKQFLNGGIFVFPDWPCVQSVLLEETNVMANTVAIDFGHLMAHIEEVYKGRISVCNAYGDWARYGIYR